MDGENQMSKSKSPIPIKNLFFMLCYAWNVLSIKDTVKLQEESFDNVYNLLTRLLIFGVRKIVKRGFNRSYIEQEESLSTVRGKINLNETIKLRLKHEMKCVCTFDEFSKNNPFNQIVKYTILSTLKNNHVDNSLKKDLRSLLLYFNDIDSLEPTNTVVSRLSFNRNNQYYKMLINICVMIYKGTMVNEENGERTFKDFFREEQMQKVYELFILNFYAINLDKSVYRVHAPKIKWVLEDNAEERFGDLVDVVDNPADRRTDIVIENRKTSKQLILDAKYYTETLVHGYYDSTIERYRTRHIEQIRGYVTDSGFEGKKIGALVYPTVKDDFPRPRLTPLQDAMVVFKTLNLNQEWALIEEDMLRFVTVLEQLVDR